MLKTRERDFVPGPVETSVCNHEQLHMLVRRARAVHDTFELQALRSRFDDFARSGAATFPLCQSIFICIELITCYEEDEALLIGEDTHMVDAGIELPNIASRASTVKDISEELWMKKLGPSRYVVRLRKDEMATSYKTSETEDANAFKYLLCQLLRGMWWQSQHGPE